MKRVVLRRHNGQVIEHTINGVPQPLREGIGDKIARVATPIARALRLPCIDPATQELRAESGCAKRRAKLNKLGEKLGL